MALEWFTLVDFDDSGEINQGKFVTLVRESLGMEDDEEHVKKCFDEMDKNGDQSLTVDEFKSAIHQILS